MMRWLGSTVVLLVVGCGSPPADSPGSASEPPPSVVTTEAPPPSRTIVTEGVIDKRVGQPGGFGCGDGPDASCDVTFTVTAVELDPSCPGASPPAGTKLLRIEVDAAAAPAFAHDPPAAALLLSKWSVETTSGSRDSDLRIVEQCSPAPGVFIAPLRPGTHPRDDVVVVVPTDVTFLWLNYEQTAWRWLVRPPV